VTDGEEAPSSELLSRRHVVIGGALYRQRSPKGIGPIAFMEVMRARGAKFDVVMPMIKELTPERAMSDADAYLDYLRGHDQVADGPVGTTGYCMGGALALRTAAHRPDDVASAAAFHPARLATDAPDSPHLLADRIRAEVYVAAADKDQGMPPEQQRRLDAALTEAGVRHVCEQYDGATHGFTMADTAVYDEAATVRHWQALLPLLASTLKG